MEEPVFVRAQSVGAPSFHLIGRQPLRPGSIVLASATMVGVLWLVLAGLSHVRHGRLSGDGDDPVRSASAGARADGSDDDDPSTIDTIVLGDPADAPVPAKRGDHVSPVHPTILVRLPRFGDQTGLIPDGDAGRLLYRWLAAFNQGKPDELAEVLPNSASGAAVTAEMEMRRETGGFALISAKEVQPGLLVFRLRDQTREGGEVLGSLRVVPYSIPARVASFSLRAVPAEHTGGGDSSAQAGAGQH